MSLETVHFGLPDPLQANVTVKAYDCLALFLDVKLLEDNSTANAAKKASVIQTLSEFNKLVKYYHDNGTLTTFYLADINDATVRTAMDNMTSSSAQTNGWVLMWIRGGGKLENNAMHISGGVSASILDDMLRYNSRHDPAIDSILAYSSLSGPDVPVATSDTYKLFTTTNTNASVNTTTAPTAFTATAAASTAPAPEMQASAKPSEMTHVHYMFIGLALITGYVLFMRKN